MKFEIITTFEVEAASPDEALAKVYLVICQEADPDGATRGVTYRGDLTKTVWTESEPSFAVEQWLPRALRRAPRQEFCKIHPTEPLEDTHPADVENGPHPNDVYNERICMTCARELEAAEYGAHCIEHRRPCCQECPLIDADGPEQTEYEAQVWQRSDGETLADGRIFCRTSTNDNLDRGAPSEDAAWELTYQNRAQFEKLVGRSRVGCSGIVVTVTLDGEPLR